MQQAERLSTDIKLKDLFIFLGLCLFQNIIIRLHSIKASQFQFVCMFVLITVARKLYMCLFYINDDVICAIYQMILRLL